MRYLYFLPLFVFLSTQNLSSSVQGLGKSKNIIYVEKEEPEQEVKTNSSSVWEVLGKIFVGIIGTGVVYGFFSKISQEEERKKEKLQDATSRFKNATAKLEQHNEKIKEYNSNATGENGVFNSLKVRFNNSEKVSKLNAETEKLVKEQREALDEWKKICEEQGIAVLSS